MPEWDEARAGALARRLRLRLDPRRRQHEGGGYLGAGAGASLEFHDHRAYYPGDDLRHLDWGVYARSDQLVLRRHRKEVSPRTEIVLDLSVSMAVTPDKGRLAATIAALLAQMASAEGADMRLWLLGRVQRRARGGSWLEELRRADFDGAAGLEHQPAPRLEPGAERVLVSDGLCPSGGRAVVRSLGREARSITLVQVMTRAEHEPEPLGAVRLEDVEGAGALDLVHDAAACAAYRERLARHQAGWEAALRGRGAGLVSCVVEDGVDAAVEAMVHAGLLEVVGR